MTVALSGRPTGGDRIVAGASPQRFFEMNLKRIGDTDWPSAGAVKPK